MKTIVLNQLNNLRASCLFRDIRNANTDSLAETVLKVILILIFFLITSSNLIAQENRTIENTAQVREVTDYLSFQKNAELSSRATYSVAKDVGDLIEKVQPSVYYYSNSAKTYGEKPRDLFIDIQSLNGVAAASFPKNNIEMLIIKIKQSTELSMAIDLSLLSSLKKLKYIYIISSVNTSQENIVRMIRNNDEKYTVFYKIEKGE